MFLFDRRNKDVHCEDASAFECAPELQRHQSDWRNFEPSKNSFLRVWLDAVESGEESWDIMLCHQSRLMEYEKNFIVIVTPHEMWHLHLTHHHSTHHQSQQADSLSALGAVYMAQSDTHDWCRSDIGKNFRMEHRKKIIVHPIWYLSTNAQLKFSQQC